MEMVLTCPYSSGLMENLERDLEEIERRKTIEEFVKKLEENKFHIDSWFLRDFFLIDVRYEGERISFNDLSPDQKERIIEAILQTVDNDSLLYLTSFPEEKVPIEEIYGEVMKRYNTDEEFRRSVKEHAWNLSRVALLLSDVAFQKMNSADDRKRYQLQAREFLEEYVRKRMEESLEDLSPVSVRLTLSTILKETSDPLRVMKEYVEKLKEKSTDKEKKEKVAEGITQFLYVPDSLYEFKKRAGNSEYLSEIENYLNGVVKELTKPNYKEMVNGVVNYLKGLKAKIS